MLELYIAGKASEIHAFINYLKKQALFQVDQKETGQLSVDSGRMERVSLHLTTHLLKPTIRK